MTEMADNSKTYMQAPGHFYHLQNIINMFTTTSVKSKLNW